MPHHVRMTRHRQRLHRELATLGSDAPQVIAMRMGRLWMSGLQPMARAADRREWQRMQQEKLDAWQAGSRAMGREAMRIQQRWIGQWMQLAMQPWRWPGQDWMSMAQRDAENLLASGLAPARRRVEANARRLRRAPLR